MADTKKADDWGLGCPPAAAGDWRRRATRTPRAGGGGPAAPSSERSRFHQRARARACCQPFVMLKGRRFECVSCVESLLSKAVRTCSVRARVRVRVRGA